MKKLLTLLLLLSAAFSSVYAATYTSVQSGNWNDPATWGVATTDDVPGTGGIDGLRTGDIVIIAATHTVTVPNTSVLRAGEYPTAMFNNGFSTWTVAGLTVKNGATLQYNRSITFEAAANPFVLEPSSTLNFNTTLGSLTSYLFKSTNRTIDITSTIVIQNWNIATLPIGASSMFGTTTLGNLTIDHSTLSAEWKQSGTTAGTAGTTFNVAGTLTFNNLNGKIFSFCDKNGTAYTSGIIGNLVVRGRGASGTAGVGSTTIVVTKNVTVSGTTSKLMFHDNSASSTGTLKIGGDLTISGTATVERSATGTTVSVANSSTGSFIEFNGTVNQSVTIPALSNLGANAYNFRINNAGTVTNNTVSGAIRTFTNGWLVIVQGLVSTSPVYATASGVSYQLITASSNYTAGSEVLASMPKLEIKQGSPAPTSANVTINNSIILTGDSGAGAAPLTLATSGIQTITLGTNTVMTLGSSTYNSFSPPAGGNSGFPTSFVNIAAAGSALEVFMNTSSKSFGIGVGTAAADYRKITLGINTASYVALKISTNTTGGGTANTGFNVFTSTRRYKFEITSGALTNYTSLAFTVGASGQENLASYTTANLRLAYSTTGQSGTYDVIPSAPWTGQSATLAQTGSLISNFPSPGATTYFAYGADVPNDFTAASGSWGDVANWAAGHIPTATESVTIATGKTVTLDGASPSPYTCAALSVTGTLTGITGNTLDGTGNVTINSGGIVNVPMGSKINIGTSCGDNKAFTTASGGTLNLTGGTLVVNGQLSSNGNFNLSGGDLIIDPNSGVAGTSYSNSLGALYIGAGTAAVTGGMITFNDPVFSSSSNAPSLSYYLPAAAWTTTIKMGGNVGNSGGVCVENATTSTTGFGVYTGNNLMIDNLILNGGTTDPLRFAGPVSGASGLYVKNDVTIPAGHELKNSSAFGIGRNLINNGTLTTIGTTKFETLTAAGAVTPVTVTQTVSGSGIFKDGAVKVTDFALLLFNNTNATGITFPAVDFSTIYGITHTAGIVTMGIGMNTLTIGVSAASSGSYTYTAGRIIGKIKKWIPTGTSTNILPAGTATMNRKATIQFTTGPTAGGSLTAVFSETSPGTRNIPAVISGQTIDAVSPSGFWTVSAADGLTGGTYTATFDATGFKDPFGGAITNLTGLRLIKAPTAGNYTNAHTTAPTNLDAVTITGQTGFSDFALGGNAVALAVDFTAINAQAKGITNEVNFSTATEKDVKEFAIERSADNKTWAVIGTKAAIGGTTPAAYSFVDNTPATLSYYRVRSIELSGKDQISKVVAVKRNGGKLAVIAVSPVPTTELVNVDFSIGKSTKITIVLTDIIGRVVKTETFTTAEGANTMRVNLSNLTQGTYMMTINDGETTATQRVVKQ
jgi:hypothetical protein